MCWDGAWVEGRVMGWDGAWEEGRVMGMVRGPASTDVWVVVGRVMIGGEWVAGRLKGYRYTVVRCGKVGTSVRWVTEGTNSMSPKVLAVYCRQCCRWLQPFPPLPPPRLSRGMHMVGEGEGVWE